MTLEQIYLVIGTALANGAVTWGVIKTQLAWLRADVNNAHTRIDNLTERLNACQIDRRRSQRENAE